MGDVHVLEENFPFGSGGKSLKSVRIPTFSFLAGYKTFPKIHAFFQLVRFLSENRRATRLARFRSEGRFQSKRPL